MAERPRFDTNQLRTPDGILLVASALYFIDSFLPWNRVCVGFAGIRACGSANLWHNVGILAALIAVAIAILAATSLFSPSTNLNLPPMVLPGLAAGLVLFTVLKIVIDNEFLSYGAWIGLVLSLVVGYGGYLKYKAASTGAASPPATTPPPIP
jgi:4-amino-4-deoxy-L-arabinose transferase-like glycosyltransferase